MTTSVVALGTFAPISCNDLNTTIASETVVDVRYPADYQRGHIKDAVSLPFYSLKSIAYPKTQPIVVYCSGIGCSLSHDAAITLQELGYTNVKVLEGGIAEWSMKGFPMEGDPNATPTFKTPYIYPQWAAFNTLDVSPKALSANLNAGGNFYLIDSRPAKEYAAGHLPGAHNIAAEDLPGKISSFSKTLEYVIYDRRPDRSRTSAQKMQDTGLAAHMLAGGITVWTAQGFPLSTAPDDAK